MAKSKKEAPEIRTALGERRSRIRPWSALVLVTLAVLVFAAMVDFQPAQSPYHSSDIVDASEGGNMVGAFGTHVAYWSFRTLGVVAWVLPVVLLWGGALCVFRKGRYMRWFRVLAAVVALGACCGLAAMFPETLLGEQVEITHAELAEYRANQSYDIYTGGSGGRVGKFLYNDLMAGALGEFGCGLIYLMLGLSFGTLFFLPDPGATFRSGWERMGLWWDAQAANMRAKASERRERREVEREARRSAREEAARAKAEARAKEAEESADNSKPEASASKKSQRKKSSSLGSVKVDEEDVSEKASGAVGAVSLDEVLGKKAPEPAKPAAEAPEEKFAPKSAAKEASEAKPKSLKIIAGEEVEKATGHLVQRKGSHTFPGLDLLQDSPPRVSSGENYEETAAALVQTLSQFKVEVELGEIHSGPVITRYEVVPAPGVRVNKIENLDKDLALGLKAQSVRILAPVPGKGTVGIEVPNRKSAPVCLREIIESRAWADSDAEIPIVLGKEVTGKPVVIDLTKMPHMLIAGSTGSGKTVCINAVIASLLYKMSPDDLRFIMVDPKVVEMQGYNDLPHMLVPVVTEPKKVPGALKYLIKEMEQRFQIFAEVGVRNIAGFNAKILKSKAAREKAAQMDADLSPEERAAMNSVEVPRDKGVEIPKEKLPYIVCVIDELADLMMVAPADIEQCIARLAQLARAAGIHLILATQRPSVNVITGVIKANLPTRIAFKVASNTDSRTILDSKGAEALIGKGDMLFTPPGSMSLVRAQGAFVSDDEIGGIVNFVHEKNGAPVFDEFVQRQIEAAVEDEDGGGSTADGEYDDPMVAQAIDVIRTTKRASTSMLQRKLKIGYNRAARIMDLLEEEGIVGPDNGSSPREILQDPDML